MSDPKKVLPPNHHPVANMDEELRKFIFAGEGYRTFVYACTAGIPTIGYGTALATLVKKKTGEWKWLATDKRIEYIENTLKKKLTDNDKKLLNKALNMLNNKLGKDVQRRKGREIIGIDGSPLDYNRYISGKLRSKFDLTLTESEALKLYNSTLTEYKDFVRYRFIKEAERSIHSTKPLKGKLTKDDIEKAARERKEATEKLDKAKLTGIELYEQLYNSKEMIALISMAYNGFIRVEPELIRAIMNDTRAAAYDYILHRSHGKPGRMSIEATMFNGTYVAPLPAPRRKGSKKKPAKKPAPSPYRKPLPKDLLDSPYGLLRLQSVELPVGAYAGWARCYICKDLDYCRQQRRCPYGVR